jgi:hypothetical protein
MKSRIFPSCVVAAPRRRFSRSSAFVPGGCLTRFLHPFKHHDIGPGPTLLDSVQIGGLRAPCRRGAPAAIFVPMQAPQHRAEGDPPTTARMRRPAASPCRRGASPRLRMPTNTTASGRGRPSYNNVAAASHANVVAATPFRRDAPAAIFVPVQAPQHRAEGDPPTTARMRRPAASPCMSGASPRLRTLANTTTSGRGRPSYNNVAAASHTNVVAATPFRRDAPAAIFVPAFL